MGRCSSRNALALVPNFRKKVDEDASEGTFVSDIS